jgi:hypothetical protein
MPLPATLTIYRGDDLAAAVTVTDAATGAPADLTGYTAQSQIRASANDAAIAASFVCTIAANVITMILTHDQTQAFTRTAYVWDVQVTDPNGWITTLLAGPVEVTFDVTTGG